MGDWGPGERSGAEVIDVGVLCIPIRADAMKMDELTNGEASEGGEKRVKGRTLGNAYI